MTNNTVIKKNGNSKEFRTQNFNMQCQSQSLKMDGLLLGPLFRETKGIIGQFLTGLSPNLYFPKLYRED